MGTTVTFQTFHDDPQKVEAVFQKGREEVERLIEIFTDYDDESELLQLVREERVGAWTQVSHELWEVLRTADLWHGRSAGQFDISVGPLTKIWRQARRKKSVPSDESIEEALACIGWKKVEFDPAIQSVRIMKKGMRLDVGAIAKGYIMDRAYATIAQEGLKRTLVRSGGDMRCGDAPPGRDGWRIEIGVLADPSQEPPRLLLCNEAIATSGDLFQYVEHNGKRISHVLDPHTGQGIEGPRAATVIAKTGIDADAAATTLCILGNEAGLQLLEHIEGIEARIAREVQIDGERKIEIVETPGMTARRLSPK